MTNWLSDFFKKTSNPKIRKIVSVDALPDNRPIALKEKDYSTAEIVTSAIAPFNNPKILTPTATEFNQWYVGSCVPHGMLTQLEYEGIATPDVSRLRLYRKRSNYPQSGSIGTDIYDKAKDGVSNDFVTPPYFTEAQATAMPLIAGIKTLKEFSYFQYIDKATGSLLLRDVPIDVATGKAVAIFIFATEEEWSKQYVEVIDPNLKLDGASVRHCVCIIPKGDFTENGKRWLAIQDSAKFGGFGIRYVEYDKFFLTRTYFAGKVYAKDNLPVVVLPDVDMIPDVACELGQKGDAVLALQRFLNKEGKLESQYMTGYYGALTSKAVLWWQLEHWNEFNITIPQILDLGGKYWGNVSIKIATK